MELCRALNVNVEENIPSRALRFENRCERRAVEIAVHFGPLGEFVPVSARYEIFPCGEW